MKLKINALFVLLIVGQLHSCKAQIKNTVWKNNTVDCDQYIFSNKNKARYINCESGDTISCIYFVRQDTIIIDHIKSVFDKDFPANSEHRLQRYRTFFLVNGDKFYPLWIEDHKDGKWIKNLLSYENGTYYLKKGTGG